MSKTTILIVEDEAIVAADLAGKLGRLGYEVAGTAAQGDAAVALASQLRPRLVPMDIWLKGPMDGIEAADAIHRQLDVPVIFLTAHSDPATLARAKLTGPFGYILKPFEERDLATQIEMAIYRHQADRQLRQEREWLRVTLTSIGDAVIATDAEGRITFLNPVAEALTGWTTEAAAGQPVQGVFHIVNEQTGQALEEPVARVLRERRAVGLANHAALVTKDGRTVPVEDSAAPILDATGQVVGVVLVFHDVTGKRRAEAALRESERKFRSLFENSMDAIFLTVPDGTILAANQAACAMFGMTEEEICRAGRDGLIDRDDPRHLSALDQRADTARFRGEFRYVRKDGTKFHAEAGSVVLDGGTRAFVILRDITVRKRAEERLRASEERFQQITACVQDVLYSVDGATREFQYVSPAFERLLGYTPADVAARGGRERFLAEVIQDGRFGEQQQVLGQLMAGNGEALPGRWEAWWRGKDGTLKCLEDQWIPVFAGGRLAATYGVLRDITDRKRAEEEMDAAKGSAERAKAVAEQANRTKDHFLAVLSHELRTPLTPVVMGVSMLQDDPNLNPRVRETLEMVRRNIEMEARLIDDLLDVTRIARGKIELTRSAVELGTVIQRAVEVCKPDIEARKLHFGVDMGPALPFWIDADVSRLQQVFWNLLRNAIKFTPHGGCVGVRCRLDGTQVVVEVNDSGIGIEPEALSRIFNAFEQAELSITRQFGGLGLGLAISKALVEMHGGQIDALSEGRDKGSTFRVRLPLTRPVVQPEVSPPAVRPQRAVRPLRVLLVEDHGVTAKLMKMVLTTEGHTVEMAGDVATAVQLAGRQAFDLLLSDLGLPDGSGHDLMRQLRERRHTFPGIALSGYGQEEDIRRSYEAGFIAHLTKPASREAIVEAIATVTAGDG